MAHAHPLPRHPGHRRRCAVPDRPRGHRRPVHARPSAASYQGLFGAVFGISFLIGPALGGFLTDNDQLALDLLRQHPDRARQPVRDLARLLPTIKRPRRRAQPRLSRARWSSRSRSCLLLVGLTNKQSADWTDPRSAASSPLGLLLARCSSSSRVARPRSRSSRSGPVAQPDVRRVDHRRRSSSASGSSARSSSCRAGSRSSSARARPNPATRSSRCSSGSSAARSCPGSSCPATGTLQGADPRRDSRS